MGKRFWNLLKYKKIEQYIIERGWFLVMRGGSIVGVLMELIGVELVIKKTFHAVLFNKH
jgi:hypothetical protein